MKRILFLGFLLLAACEKNIMYRGTKIDADDYNFIKSYNDKKSLTKKAIIEKIGYPSILLSDDHWIYIYQEVKKQSFLIPKVIHSEAVTITFNEDNSLRNISRKILKHRFDRKLENDTTKIDDHDLTFLKQMYYNIYKIGQ